MVEGHNLHGGRCEQPWLRILGDEGAGQALSQVSQVSLPSHRGWLAPPPSPKEPPPHPQLDTLGKLNVVLSVHLLGETFSGPGLWFIHIWVPGAWCQ